MPAPRLGESADARMMRRLAAGIGMTDGRETIALGDAPLTLEGFEALALGRVRPALSDAAGARIARGRAVVESVAARGVPAYGVTTGVGSQKDSAVDPAAMGRYNDMLITAHATSAPAPFAAREVVRGALVLQLHLFASGRSGIRAALAEALLARLLADDLPQARLGSSVGASDIVAMAQLGVPMIAGRAGLGKGGSGPAPMAGLAAKEGLSLLSSNSLTQAEGALAVAEAGRLLAAMHAVAAMALEGFRGNPGAWSEMVSAMRGQPAQARVTAALQAALAGSALLEPGAARLLQDPLSFRFVPQIHAACETALDLAKGVWERELNAIVDNPFADWEGDRLVSHGNMDTSLQTLALDALRLALAKAGDAAGERIHKIQWMAFSGLPTGLAREVGVSGGVQFLNLGHIAAAQATAMRQAANPVLLSYRGHVNDGVEDVAGAAPFAVRETRRLLDAGWILTTIEAICAAWAIDRRGLNPARLGAGVAPLYRAIRPKLPIGTEGEAIFDIAPVVAVLRDSGAALSRAR